MSTAAELLQPRPWYVLAIWSTADLWAVDIHHLHVSTSSAGPHKLFLLGHQLIVLAANFTIRKGAGDGCLLRLSYSNPLRVDSEGTLNINMASASSNVGVSAFTLHVVVG